MNIPMGLVVLLLVLVLSGTLWMVTVTWMLSKVWCFYCDMPDPPLTETVKQARQAAREGRGGTIDEILAEADK